MLVGERVYRSLVFIEGLDNIKRKYCSSRRPIRDEDPREGKVLRHFCASVGYWSKLKQAYACAGYNQDTPPPEKIWPFLGPQSDFSG